MEALDAAPQVKILECWLASSGKRHARTDAANLQSHMHMRDKQAVRLAASYGRGVRVMF